MCLRREGKEEESICPVSRLAGAVVKVTMRGSPEATCPNLSSRPKSKRVLSKRKGPTQTHLSLFSLTHLSPPLSSHLLLSIPPLSPLSLFWPGLIRFHSLGVWTVRPKVLLSAQAVWGSLVGGVNYRSHLQRKPFGTMAGSRATLPH